MSANTLLDATLKRWRSDDFAGVMLAGAPGAWTAGEVAHAIDTRIDELVAHLEALVSFHGRRGGPDDNLLPIEDQDAEIADAMHAISKAHGTSTPEAQS